MKLRIFLRGRILTFKHSPAGPSDETSYLYLEDGGIIIENEKIVKVGDFAQIKSSQPNLKETDYRPCLLMPGFIDVHNHFPQLPVIGSFGTQLLAWLQNYTFPEEAKYSNYVYSKKMARLFINTLLDHGTTTSVSFGSVHPQSVDALFAEALRLNMCFVAGKVLMDRNAPKEVLDTPETAYDDSKKLIEKWHHKHRLKYAISPRFAITSSPHQMEVAGALVQEYPSCFVQSHLAENVDEIKLTLSLYPKFKNYLDIYFAYGLTGPKTLLGHAIHLSSDEKLLMAQTKTVAVHCPTSNLFLGSGLFDLESLTKFGITSALATDTGGGTSFSMLKTLDEAYKIQQLQNFCLNPLNALYWITLGNAKALGLELEIGTLDEGSFADLIVLDSRATSLSKHRMKTASSLSEELFILQTLGDDRAVKAVYLAGQKVI